MPQCNQELVIYKSKDGTVRLDVQLEQETVWLNREQLSTLFGRDRTVISRHINNIFKEGELAKEVVCANFAHTTPHGAIEGKTQSKQVEHYNLDAHQMAELFGRDRTVILRHLRNVYSTGELGRKATCAKIAQVAADGKTRQMDIFNLDAIITWAEPVAWGIPSQIFPRASPC